MAGSKRGRRDTQPGHLRIIGGSWRGRKLRFTPAPGLRPTGDRIRETLFNWLSPDIVGAHCADLFAGSGALGLEALSRGAAHCEFVDNSRAAVQQIADHLGTLDATERASCHNRSAEQFIAAAPRPLDIVFLDPPFGLDLITPTARLLAEHGTVKPGSLVYVESAVTEQPILPDNWSAHRQRSGGGVSYSLWRVEGG
jgi:16S rRNA (guanine966-N2)-methyltransferase